MGGMPAQRAVAMRNMRRLNGCALLGRAANRAIKCNRMEWNATLTHVEQQLVIWNNREQKTTQRGGHQSDPQHGVRQQETRESGCGGGWVSGRHQSATPGRPVAMISRDRPTSCGPPGNEETMGRRAGPQHGVGGWVHGVDGLGERYRRCASGAS